MKKSVVLALSASLALSGVLTGCSEKESAGADPSAAPGAGASAAAAASAKPEAPTEISLTTINYSAEAPANDNPIELEMEKITNTKLNITYLPSNNYGDKFKVMLASGELPDVLLTTWIYDSAVLTAIKDGAFWDLTPFVKDYPNLQKVYPKESFDNTKVNGKIYGIPRPRPVVGGVYFPALRQDWLEKLSLKTPETMDELYTVLKAFTEKDPDGNGKNDTYGFTGHVAEGWMDSLDWVMSTFNGFTNQFLFQPGKPAVARDFSPATRDALAWLQKAYKEGVLAPDFAISKGTQTADMMKQGKVGMYPTSMDNKGLGDVLGAIRKNTPGANIVHLPYLVSPATNQKYAIKESGVFGNYLISKKVPEAKVKKILEFFDKGATPEGMQLASYGIKDVHFTLVDGRPVTNEEHKKLAGPVHNNVWTNIDPYSRITQASADYPKEYFERDKKIIDERLKYGVYYNDAGVTSETEIKVGTELGKKIQDMRVKVIMGKETMEAWDKFAGQMMNDANYKKIMAEKEASYKTLYGN